MLLQGFTKLSLNFWYEVSSRKYFMKYYRNVYWKDLLGSLFPQAEILKKYSLNLTGIFYDRNGHLLKTFPISLHETFPQSFDKNLIL